MSHKQMSQTPLRWWGGLEPLELLRKRRIKKKSQFLITRKPPVASATSSRRHWYNVPKHLLLLLRRKKETWDNVCQRWQGGGKPCFRGHSSPPGLCSATYSMSRRKSVSLTPAISTIMTATTARTLGVLASIVFLHKRLHLARIKKEEPSFQVLTANEVGKKNMPSKWRVYGAKHKRKWG